MKRLISPQAWIISALPRRHVVIASAIDSVLEDFQFPDMGSILIERERMVPGTYFSPLSKTKHPLAEPPEAWGGY